MLRPSLHALIFTTVLLCIQTWGAWGGGQLQQQLQRLQGNTVLTPARKHRQLRRKASRRPLPPWAIPPPVGRRFLPPHLRSKLPVNLPGGIGRAQGRRLLRKAKGDEKSGPAKGQSTCTAVYLGGYHGGLGDDDYVAYEFGSGNDANESDPVMFDALIADHCNPLPQEDWLPFVIPGSESIYDTGITWKKLDGDPPKWETWELSDGRDVYSLPEIEDSCDEDTFEKGNSACETKELTWSCNVTDSAGLQAKLQKVQRVVADDCFTTPKCMGAPYGEIKCSFSPIPVGKYVVGMDMVVNGDRCAACSLGVDMEDGNEGELCPRFYDVHNCQFEWKLEDKLPDKWSAFEFTYTINASGPRWSGGFTWLAVALLAVLATMWG